MNRYCERIQKLPPGSKQKLSAAAKKQCRQEMLMEAKFFCHQDEESKDRTKGCTKERW